MQLQAQPRSGSRVVRVGTWEDEWAAAATVDRKEAALSRRKVVVLGAALLSAGAASVHLAVAKDHFEEYTLFGVFFVLAAIAQLVWAAWVTVRPWRPLLVA